MVGEGVLSKLLVSLFFLELGHNFVHSEERIDKSVRYIEGEIGRFGVGFDFVKSDIFTLPDSLKSVEGNALTEYNTEVFRSKVVGHDKLITIHDPFVPDRFLSELKLLRFVFLDSFFQLELFGAEGFEIHRCLVEKASVSREFFNQTSKKQPA